MHRFIYLYTYLPIGRSCQYIYQFIYLSISWFIYVSIWNHSYQSIYLSIYLYIYLSIYVLHDLPNTYDKGATACVKICTPAMNPAKLHTHRFRAIRKKNMRVKSLLVVSSWKTCRLMFFFADNECTFIYIYIFGQCHLFCQK